MYPIEIVRTAPRRLIGLIHRGPYVQIGDTYAQLRPLLATAGIDSRTTTLVAVYDDDPWSVPESELSSFAGVSHSWKKPVPEGMQERRMPGTRCVLLHHTGHYETLPMAYAQISDWMAARGERAAGRPPFEVYLNTPMDTAPELLRTDIYWPVA